jgi:predicted glutamine amidotransferase
LDILHRFLGNNTDGIGAVFVKDGKFNVMKAPASLPDLLQSEKGKDFLSHMPYNGWTIAHLRMASQGANKIENTHPFIINDWGIVHNGHWSDFKIAKLAMSKSREFKGETDSEVAGNLIDILGPQKFAEEISFGGVYLGLRREGDLWAIKTSTSGDLEMFKRTNGTYLLASKFDPTKYQKSFEAKAGCHHFAADGTFIESIEKTYSYQGSNNSWRGYHSTPTHYSSPSNNGCSVGTGCSTPVGQSAKNVPMSKEELDYYQEIGYGHT